MAGIGRESGTSRALDLAGQHSVRHGSSCAGLVGNKVRDGQDKQCNDSGAYQAAVCLLVCSSGRVPGESGMLLPISKNRNCLLSMSCVRARHNPLAEIVWDFGLLCLAVCYHPWSVLGLRWHLVFRWRRVCVPFSHFLSAWPHH